jgi:hypothetical protein
MQGSCVGPDCDSPHFKRNEVPHNEYDWHKLDRELEKRIVLQCKYKKTCCKSASQELIEWADMTQAARTEVSNV